MDSDDPLETVSGSQGMTGAADSTLRLKRERMSRDAELFISGRNLEEQKVALRWDPMSTTWTMLGDRLTENREAIVKVLRHANEPVAVKEIASAIGKTYDHTKVLCSRMAQANQIVQLGKGFYRSIPVTTETLLPLI